MVSSSRKLLAVLQRRVREDEFRFTFTQSGGPGGQNVNKVSTRVTLWFDLDNSPSLTEREKRRLRTKLAGRVTKDGRLRVVSLRHRTQLANRRAATERFYELLAGALYQPKERRPTPVPRSARKRRLNEKRQRGWLKRLRSVRGGDNCDS